MIDLFGVLADWFTGVIAAIALFFAARAAKAAKETNAAQQETLELQRQQYERAQASKVTFWVDTTPMSFETPPGGGVIVNMEHPKTARVSNASDSPIYTPYLVQTIPATDFPVVYKANYLFPTGAEPVIWDLRKTGRAQVVVSHDLYFTDANGIVWIRKQAGELIRASHKDEGNLYRMLAESTTPPELLL